MIAGRDARDALADLLDHTRALVSQHGRRIPGRVGADSRIEVGVADAAGGKAHQHLTRPRPVELDVLDDSGLANSSRTAARILMRRDPNAKRSGQRSA